MKLEDILKPNLIIPSLEAKTKAALLSEMAEFTANALPEFQTPSSIIIDYLQKRESLGSTGIGEGVAIPHAKVPGLDRLVACFGRSRDGIDYSAIDSHSVHLIFMLLIPENSGGIHLKALARISRILKDSDFRSELKKIDTSKDLYDAFIEREREF